MARKHLVSKSASADGVASENSPGHSCSSSNAAETSRSLELAAGGCSRSIVSETALGDLLDSSSCGVRKRSITSSTGLSGQSSLSSLRNCRLRTLPAGFLGNSLSLKKNREGML